MGAFQMQNFNSRMKGKAVHCPINETREQTKGLQMPSHDKHSLAIPLATENKK